MRISPRGQPNHQEANLTIDHLPATSLGDGTMNSYYSHVRPEILNLVPTSATKILDVGCGAGVLGASLKLRQSAEVHGVEITNEAANKAAIYLDHVWNCPIELALPNIKDGYYDCIVAADVLEHVIDPWATLTTLKDKMSPKGQMVVSLPNVQNWGVVSHLLEGKWDYRAEGILDRTHLHFFTRKSVEELFWNAGLHITCLETTIRGPSLPNKLLGSLQKCGLMADSLKQDAETFQFLVVAENPKSIPSQRVAIIILNWNGKEDTLECLASVMQLDYPNYEVVVVDNGSSDGSAEVIASQYPDVTVLQTGKNLGYAGGNNVGIRWALNHNSDFVLVLNNDTVVAKDMLSHLVKAALLDDRIGLLGPTNYYYSEPSTVWAVGAMLTDPRENGYKILGDGDADSSWKIATQVDALVGSAMLIKASVLRELDLFDEKFFLCWEEYDFSARAHNIGYKCYFVPAAKIWHKVGSSLGKKESPLRIYFNVRNRLLWAKKNLSRSVRIRLHKETLYTLRRILLPPLSLPKTQPSVKKVMWSLYSWLKTLKRNLANPINQATLLGFRDYYFGKFGNCPPKVRTLRQH